MSLLSCSTVSKNREESLIGTAQGADAYLLVEARFPWKNPLEDSPDVAPIRSALLNLIDRNTKVVCIGCDPEYSRKGFRRYVRMQRDVRSMSYVGTEFFLPYASEETLLPDLLRDPQSMKIYAGNMLGNVLLICVDGGRDRCCGRYGQPLFRQLRSELHDVHVLQSSHLGGHRFAPTALYFKDASMWGRLTADMVHGIVHQTLSFAEVAPLYRGRLLFDAREQCIEKDIRIRHGWNTISTISTDGGIYTVDVEAGHSSTRECYQVRVAEEVLIEVSCDTDKKKPTVRYDVQRIS